MNRLVSRFKRYLDFHVSALVGLFAVAVLVALASCGGTNTVQVNSSGAIGTVRVSVSDPPSCKFPAGNFKSVFVTIRSVQAHVSSAATDGTAGWQELAPQLANAPMQLDLLADPQNTCVLSQLGSAGIPVGDYQQIRLILVSNNPAAGSSVPATNACGSQGYNCVVLSDNSIHQLLLSSQDLTGLKIPPGQIVGGPIRVADGQTIDLNIDFNTCASVLLQGNNQYRLRPTLTAGQVSTISTGLTGQIVDAATMLPISGGQTLVALEQPDSTGTNRIVMQASPDANGNFNFCPLPSGTYDVVAVATSGAGAAYNATAVLNVPSGSALGKVPLVAETANPPLGLAEIVGDVTATTGSAGFTADIVLSAFQTVTPSGGTARLLNIPLQNSSAGDSTPTVTTEANASCPVNTNCKSYQLFVPASNPSFGVFASGGTTFSTPATGDVLFQIEGRAFVPSSGGTTTCSPSSLTTDKDSTDHPLKVTGGASVTAKRLEFTGCS